MKKIALLLLVTLSANVFAASAKLNGFIGLNLFDYTKISNEDATSAIGFDTFTGTITGTHENVEGKIKLNLDLSKDEVESNSYFLFDEVSITYNHEDMLYLTVGKKELPFNSFHYGAIKNYYVDGGSFYDHNTYRPSHFRNDNPVLLTTLKYFSENLGINNEFTFFGRDITQETTPTNTYNNEVKTKTFNLSEQRGFTDKISYTPNENHKVTLAAYWYNNDIAPEASVAGHLFYEYFGDALNLWGGYTYGDYHGHHKFIDTRSASYPVNFAREHIAQIGSEYNFSELMNFYFNFEYYMTTDREYQIDSSNRGLSTLDGEKTSNSARIEVGTKFKMAKHAFINLGLIHERNSLTLSESMDSDKDRYVGLNADDTLNSNVTALVTSLSYWF